MPKKRMLNVNVQALQTLRQTLLLQRREAALGQHLTQIVDTQAAIELIDRAILDERKHKRASPRVGL